MVTFSPDSDLQSLLDWRILQNGAISLYLQQSVLAEDIVWLREYSYIVHEFDCARWLTENDVHNDLSKTLGFPSWYGRNLAALNDSLGDIIIPDDGGVALVLRAYDAFARTLPPMAQSVLDIIESSSRWHLLFGRRFIALAQSSDPDLTFEPVGACPVTWNRREWPRTKRGL